MSPLGLNAQQPDGVIKRSVKRTEHTSSYARNNNDYKRQQISSRESQLQHNTQPPLIQQLLDNMVYVKGGTFNMGSDEKYAYEYEKPVHQVTLSDYYIGRYEVTQEEWNFVMGNKLSVESYAKRPVENITWEDCQKFVCKLNEITGRRFRLPSEAEWEFAARGGIKSDGYLYSGDNSAQSICWYSDNSDGATHDVGQLSPNECGLYDMSGNVWEWCQDLYGEYPHNSQYNPMGASSGNLRVVRGGCFNTIAEQCRSTFRGRFNQKNSSSSIGLRLAY